MENNIPIFQNPQLDGNQFFWKGSSTGVILIHGFTATTVEIRQMAVFFKKKGLSVAAPLLPGHGTSPEDLNKRKYCDWITSVESAYSRIRKECSRLIIGGESMGAVLSLYLAANLPDIDALLLYSPALFVNKLKYAKILKYIKPIIYKGNYDEKMPWQGYTTYPLHAAHEFLKLQKLIIKILSRVNQPSIIFQGKYDQTIDSYSGNFIFEHIVSDIKVFEKMKNSAHVMLLDKEFDLIAEKTWRFLKYIEIV